MKEPLFSGDLSKISNNFSNAPNNPSTLSVLEKRINRMVRACMDTPKNMAQDVCK